MTKKALFCEVDVQNDFVSGSLAVAQALEEGRLANMLYLSACAPLLVGSVDSHDFRAWEFASNENKGPSDEDPQFPDHCVVGTWGWQRVKPEERKDAVFIPDVSMLDAHSGGYQRALNKRLTGSSSIFLMKEVYSLFSNPNATYIVGSLLNTLESNDVVVYGIATDYCVKEAVEGFLKLGVKVHVPLDAIAAVDKQMGEVVVATWRTKGVNISTAAELASQFGKV